MQAYLMKALWFLLFASLIVSLWGDRINVQPTLVQTKNIGENSSINQKTPATVDDFRIFARQWVAHGALLDFSADGKAVFMARAYRWCGPGVVQPCDTIEPGGRIHNGYQEQIQFSQVKDSVAYGTIAASNMHPKGLAVTATLQSNDVLLYAAETDIAHLCGPKAPLGACGA